MVELRYNTTQQVVVGPILDTQGDPISDQVLRISHWFLRADWGRIPLISHNWVPIPGVAGYYMLSIPFTDVSAMGQAEIYIYDPGDMLQPISLKCRVISQNMWDAKYNSTLLKTEPFAQKG